VMRSNDSPPESGIRVVSHVVRFRFFSNDAALLVASRFFVGSVFAPIPSSNPPTKAAYL
jgi:hypothetical protein